MVLQRLIGVRVLDLKEFAGGFEEPIHAERLREVFIDAEVLCVQLVPLSLIRSDQRFIPGLPGKNR